MNEREPLAERLRALRQRNSPATAPLWIETLPPEEALEELQDRQGMLFRLQECHKLLEFGRVAEAAERLRTVDVPAGLENARLALLERAESAESSADASGIRLEGEPLRGTLPSAEAALLEWLERVRGWRRNLHV